MIEIRIEFMTAVQHVQVTVTNIESSPRVRAVADSLAQTPAGPGFQLHEHRNPEFPGLRFFRRDIDLPETLGVREVELCLPEPGIRERPLPGLNAR